MSQAAVQTGISLTSDFLKFNLKSILQSSENNNYFILTLVLFLIWFHDSKITFITDNFFGELIEFLLIITRSVYFLKELFVNKTICFLSIAPALIMVKCYSEANPSHLSNIAAYTDDKGQTTFLKV